MNGQTTIFDFLKPESTDIESMTDEQIAKIIGDAIGVTFKHNGWLNVYSYKTRKYEFQIYQGHYSVDTKTNKKGDAYISCNYSCNTSGCGSPIDTIENAIDFFRKKIIEWGF